MKLTRRSFIRFVGLGAGSLMLTEGLGPLAAVKAAGGAPRPAPSSWTRPDGTPDWTPVDYPLPHPGDGGDAASDASRFAQYVVRDDLVLPEGFRHDVIAQWGDRFNAGGAEARFGFNADYTGLVRVPGSADEYWLLVNHEYISGRSWIQGYEAAHREPLPSVRLLAGPDERGRLEIGGVVRHDNTFDLARAADDPTSATPLAAARSLCERAMADLGISVLRVRRLGDGRFEVVSDAKDHRRYTGLGGPSGDGTPTYANCSGATTPWGTFLSCEENFQDQVMEFITAAGTSVPGRVQAFKGLGVDDATHLPFEFEGLRQGVDSRFDGRDFGWVVMVDPATGDIEKLPSLGRFRHENVAMRVERGQRLVAYLGDDRRGGHVWKFVSDGVVEDPQDKSNAQLLRQGTLYAAKLEGDYTGRWIPLVPETPLVTPEPEHLASGHLWLPDRQVGGHVAVGTPRAKSREVSVARWVSTIERFTGKPLSQSTLGDLVDPSVADPQRVLLLDAYAMANAAGATPTSRPEDIEVHPGDGSVYIAFTDSTGSGDGSPDTRVFPDSRGANSRQYGAIYRIAEDHDDPASATFKWGRFVASGELADGGSGFACADNLAFDPQGNLWMVTDITTPAHNRAVEQRLDATAAGGKEFVGVFGNNALFMIPTAGPDAGVPHCFAIGPMECELTGPTFTDDGRTLILSVQHPGELHGTRGLPGVGQPLDETRPMSLATRDGQLFTQQRTVPLGSNFPSQQLGTPPRPCVVCITRNETGS